MRLGLYPVRWTLFSPYLRRLLLDRLEASLGVVFKLLLRAIELTRISDLCWKRARCHRHHRHADARRQLRLQAIRRSGAQLGNGHYGLHLCRLFAQTNTGLLLSTTRAYNPANGKWLNVDPIRETGGVNLFGYVDGNPMGG